MDIEKIKKSPRFIGEVNSGVLNMLPNSTKGDITYTKDTKQVLVYSGKKWEPIEDKIINTGMSLMEINRSIIAQLPTYKAEKASEKVCNLINDFCIDSGTYFMLYGKEISYFTLFKINDTSPEYVSISAAVLDCLSNVGDIYTIDLTDDKTAIEIWIRTFDKGATTCLYLFPYDNGVVRVE